MFLTLIIAFFSLIGLMIIHEFGHFIIAKKFGVKVEEFGIGYPPRLFGKQVGETLYSVNLIPLGAFVKIYGEEGAEGIDDYRSFANLAIWKRILIVLGGVLAFWIASMVIFSVVFAIGATVPVGDQDVVGINTTNVVVMSVAVSEEDNKILAIGLEAKQMIGRTPDSIIAYRPMKDGVIADYRVTEAMLRYYIDKAMGKWNIIKPDVLVSVPAGVTSTERRAVIEAAIKAGAKNAYVVKEPILAAIGAGIPIHEAMGYMIVDALLRPIAV
jgi:membrane-associated protease RseP (regulator of RpoE activity)